MLCTIGAQVRVARYRHAIDRMFILQLIDFQSGKIDTRLTGQPRFKLPHFKVELASRDVGFCTACHPLLTTTNRGAKLVERHGDGGGVKDQPAISPQVGKERVETFVIER